MSKQMPWIRLHTEARKDNKLRLLDDHQFRVWMNLLCMAGEQHTERGTVPSGDLDLLAIEAAAGDLDLLIATRDLLIRFKIIVDEGDFWRFIQWDNRQYDHASDTPEEVGKRVTRHREKKRIETGCNDTVTDCNDVKRPRTEQNRGEQRRTEENRGEQRGGERASAPDPPAPKSDSKPSRKQKASTCPADLSIDDDFRKWRDEKHPDVPDSVLQEYIEIRRDRAIAKGTVYADWHAAIKVWFRQDMSEGRIAQTAAPVAPKETPLQESMRLYRAENAKQEKKYADWLEAHPDGDENLKKGAAHKLAAIRSERAEAEVRFAAVAA